MAVNFRFEAMQSGRYVDLFPKTALQTIVGTENVLQIKTLSVNIPAPDSEEVVQTLAITTDDKMINSPFEVYLVEDTEEAKKSYATIHQVEIQKDSLIITRLHEMPTTSITVTIVFFEAGV